MPKNTKLHGKTIAVFGFCEEECRRIASCLSVQAAELFVTDCITDLIAIDHMAVIIRADSLTESEIEQLLLLGREAVWLPSDVVIVGECAGLREVFLTYPDLDALLHKLKYLLLNAYKHKKKAETFSRSLSHALGTLKLIAENPGISSREIAERLELSPRSVTRYIETLNLAGESIVYDRKRNGWSLEFAESLLKLGV